MLLMILSCSLLIPASGDAQRLHDITGTVTDSTGGVLVGALVELIDGAKHSTTRTDERGQYRFTSVAPGEYDLRISADGFRPAIQRFNPASRETIDVVLEVLVTAEAYVAAVGDRREAAPAHSLSTRTFSGADLDELPSEPGQLLRRLWELAGATGRPGDLAMYVDGFRQVLRLQSTEAIQMIRINSNPFAAEFAEPGRARIEIVTKPGSDRYVGELKGNLSDSTLSSRNALAPTRARAQTRNYTGYASGPIVPHRWSLVLYSGRWEQNSTAVVNAAVLEPETLTPSRLATEVVTPRSINNVWLGSNYQPATGHTVALSLSYTHDAARNQGLEGGLDLPERAYRDEHREYLARVAATSMLSPRLLHEVRVEGSRRDSETQALTDAPAAMVLDAFNAGGNQDNAFGSSRVDGLQLSDHVTFALGKSTMKFGAAAEVIRQRRSDRSYFGGTFVFGADVERDAQGVPGSGSTAVVDPLETYRRTLSGVPGYGPSQFWIVRGDPHVGFSQWWGGWFAQGDWVPSSRVTVSYGVRQDVQAHVERTADVAPRLGVAWSPDAKGTLRAGAGLFYQRIPPTVTLDTIRFDGQRQQRLVVSRPTFFPEIPQELPEAVTRVPTVYVLAAEVEAPRSLLGTLSYERRLFGDVVASVGYSYERGEHLLRTRNVNAPIGDVRPFPDRGAVLQYESSGRLERHGMVLALRTNWSRKVTVFGNYTLGSSRSDTDRPTTAPADSYDLAIEFGPAYTDVRHQGTAGVTLRLPRRLLISAFGVISSGQPFNITTGRDDNGDTLFTERPAFADSSDVNAVVTPFGRFNPNPRDGDRTIPRNLGREPAQARVDLHVSQGVPVGLGRTTVRLSADVVNLFNRVNLTGINGVLTSPAFGRARRALDARRIDLSLGVTF
jgi:hypothetical protein